MDDATLFAIGCAVTFLALGGSYVYLRDHLYRLPSPLASEKTAKQDEQARDPALQPQN